MRREWQQPHGGIPIEPFKRYMLCGKYRISVQPTGDQRRSFHTAMRSEGEQHHMGKDEPVDGAGSRLLVDLTTGGIGV